MVYNDGNDDRPRTHQPTLLTGAATTKRHGGALVEHEVEEMTVHWQRRANTTSQLLRIYSFTLDLTLSVNNALLSLIFWRRLSSPLAFPLRM